YKQVSTLAKCKTEKGSYYIDTINTSDIYLNPFYEDDLLDVQIARRLKILTLKNSGENKFIFENLSFLSDSIEVSGTTIESQFYFFDCNFYRGVQDSFSITGVYKVFLFDCASSYASKDAFNYHTTNPISLAVEVNCIGYGSGKYKFIGGNTTTASNNGSTAHDGMNILRVGS